MHSISIFSQSTGRDEERYRDVSKEGITQSGMVRMTFNYQREMGISVPSSRPLGVDVILPFSSWFVGIRY